MLNTYKEMYQEEQEITIVLTIALVLFTLFALDAIFMTQRMHLVGVISSYIYNLDSFLRVTFTQSAI